MSTPFQNRLVGTIIVAAVVVIFLPDILDGEKTAHQTDFEAIPKAPVFSGKLTNKEFPVETLNEKPEETIIAEQAQDDLLTELIDDSSSKVTPANKTLNESTTIRVNEVLPIDEPKEEEKIAEALPEKAVAKEAWVIHLGSFKHKQNVAQLLAKLKANGYTVFTQPIKTKHGTLTKVFVGPELIKSSLDNKLIELKKLTNTTGKVARFYPNK